ncbi:MAG: DUF4270 domain-containing protein [Bacteroidaceae bacterium]|nr:DUF4270 domain-containing protein [Bacteroidaceae bacterium]
MRHYLAILLLPILIVSCTEDTSTIGMFPETDGIANSYATFDIYTKSVLLDSVLYKSSQNYLGNIKDPETNMEIKANFAAQFHTFENFKFPSKNLMFPDWENDHSQDLVECDSIEFRLYCNGYYGDPNNPMKLEVYPLSFDKIIEEDTVYYVNTDLEQFVDAGATPIATKVFTAIDYSVPESYREEDNYISNIRIALPKEYGNYLLNTFYEHPDYYKNSYNFIRKVCPGFYFKIKGGTGTMVYVEVSTLNLFFTYYDQNYPDSVYAGVYKFAATPEVIQSTQFTNGNLQELVDNDNCTYLKSPAGIGTEVTLPINEIYAGHEADSISMAQLSLTRYNNDANGDYSLDIPQNVVMVRKDDIVSFFKNKKTPNSQTSFFTTFDETFNTYTFDNLGRLLTYCYFEKLKGMESSGLSEAEWEAAHPNWNKMVIVPVSVTLTLDAYGNTSYAGLTHDMSLSSAKLVGGPNSPIKMQILYSRFK